MSEPVEIAKFGFGITGFYSNGKVVYIPRDANDKVPKEVIIMQIKSFLNKLEKDYLDQ